MNFKHTDFKVYYPACENNCIMSPVALERALSNVTTQMTSSGYVGMGLRLKEDFFGTW